MKKLETEGQDPEKTKKFVEKYWPKALVIAGAAGIIGAVIWLTARYLREKKRREAELELALKTVEKEVEASSNETVVLLETGPFLGDVSGDEGRRALIELANQMDDEQAREALELLREVIDINKRNS